MRKYVIVDIKKNTYLMQRDYEFLPTREFKSAKKFDTPEKARNILRSSVSRVMKRNFAWDVKNVECSQEDLHESVENSIPVVSTIDSTTSVLSDTSDASRLKEMTTVVAEVPVSTVNITPKRERPYSPIQINNVYENIRLLQQQTALLQQNRAWLKEEKEHIDMKIMDVLHYIESTPFSASEGYKLCKLLQDMRKYRREIKDQIAASDVLAIHGNLLNDTVSDPMMNIVTQRLYHPREIPSLFEGKHNIDVLLEEYRDCKPGDFIKS